MKSSAEKPNKRPLWQFLVPPMLLLSLGLHGVFLFMPVASSDEEPIPPPDPEEDGIAISKIDPPQSRQSTVLRTTTTQTTSVAPARPQTRQSTAAGSQRATTDRANNRRTATTASPGRRTRDRRNDDPAELPEPEDSSSAAASPNPDAPAVSSEPSRFQLPEDHADYIAQLSINIPQQLLDYIAQLRQDYDYTPKNTTDVEVEENTTEWLDELREAWEEPELEAETVSAEAGIEYPLRACLPIAPLDAKLGLEVTAAGEVEGAVNILRSTGYPGLNKAAFDAAKAHSFPESDHKRAYILTIPVEYDSDRCARATPSATG